MRRFRARLGVIALTCAVVCLGLAACGGATSNSARGSSAVTLLMAVAPDSLDPAVGSRPEALEADWLVYTPLLTYDHSSGVPGTQVIPGLASDLPTITDGGRTYSFTLHPGVVYSNGVPVRASDFTRAVERAIKLGWSGAPEMITSRIVGARAFAAGRARTISGISTDDAAGEITIHLTAPWGPFENVLALPATAPVPVGTPLKDEQGNPPPGAGPYEFAHVVPGHAFSLALNPRWQPGQLPGIPRGHVGVAVRVTGDAGLNARSVLANRADVFDSADRIPSALLPRVVRQASSRYSKQSVNSTYLIFLNVNRRPFSSGLARTAVQTGLDEKILTRLGQGSLQEGCYLLPPAMFGHPHDQCPRGNIEKGGDVAAARSLVARSGMARLQVTLWGQAGDPSSAWMRYYASLLNQIGFRTQLRLLPSPSYYATISQRELHPQTGFAELTAALPTPVDFYQRLTGASIRPRGNQNWGEIDDPYLDHQVRLLSSIPSSGLGSVSSFWHGLERYVAGHAYVAVFGYQTAPQFVSARLDYAALHFNPVMGLDWSSLRLR